MDPRRRLLAGILAIGLLPSVALGGEAIKEYTAADAEKKVLAKQTGLASGESLEVNAIRFRIGPGYQFARHYHTGDVFVYVQSGELTVETDQGRHTIRAGEVYYETPNMTMTASNTSATENTEIIVFQVGKKGDPIMVEAD